MNFDEALKALQNGKIVKINNLVYRLKILNWADAPMSDKPEWKVYFFSQYDKKWCESKSFSSEDVFCENCEIVDDFTP